MKAIKSGDEIRIEDGYLHKESIKEIPGRRYDADAKAWFTPCNEKNAALLQMLGAELDADLAAFVGPVYETAVAEETPLVRMPIRAEPYKHQVRAFNFALCIFTDKSKGVAYLMDMGTGKTLTLIALAGKLFGEGKIKRLLVVCPKSIVGVWEAEFQKFADYEYGLAVLEGDSGKKAEMLKSMKGSGLQVAVVNYESAWRLEPDIAKWKPDLIVCDESSKIKNPQAKQSKALHRLGKQSRYNMILTGTPINNNPLDFFSQYKFLDESIFGASFYSFRARYAIIGGYGNHQIVGYRNMAELVEKAHAIAFRVRIEEAVDLSPYIDETRNVQLERSAKAIYDAIDKESYAELMTGEVTTRNILTRLLRLSQCNYLLYRLYYNWILNSIIFDYEKYAWKIHLSSIAEKICWDKCDKFIGFETIKYIGIFKTKQKTNTIEMPLNNNIEIAEKIIALCFNQDKRQRARIASQTGAVIQIEQHPEDKKRLDEMISADRIKQAKEQMAKPYEGFAFKEGIRCECSIFYKRSGKLIIAYGDYALRESGLDKKCPHYYAAIETAFDKWTYPEERFLSIEEKQQLLADMEEYNANNRKKTIGFVKPISIEELMTKYKK